MIQSVYLCGHTQLCGAFCCLLILRDLILTILMACVQRVERSSAFVQRRVRLPESADMSKIKAAYNNGTLTLDIHKAEVSTPALYL